MEKNDLIINLRSQGFSEKIIKAFENIDRKDFIPKEYRADSYKDIALPIGKGQTISQPYTIAFMLTLLELENNQKILEAGSGSGYVLSLINEISKNSEIFGIERINELADKSRNLFKNKDNIQIIRGDGSKGLLKEAKKGKFDRILISASCKEIPSNLIQQLRVGGVLVAPVQNSIVYIKKFPNENKIKEFPGFVFVPLIED